MKYRDKEIVELTNEELLTASAALQDILNSRNNLKSNPRYAKRFKNQAEPGINPVFIELKNEIDEEIKNRNI